jgi:cytochrome P450
MPPPAPASEPLPTAGFRETLGVLFGIVLPTFAKGVIVRRRSMVALADRLGLDRRAIARMARLRDVHQPGPLVLRIGGRRQAILLTARDVHRVLSGEAGAFAPASDEKKATLAHFEPEVSLVSRGAERATRRWVNERVLESERLEHSFADRFRAVVADEVSRLLRSTGSGEVAWPAFTAAWHCMVRRVVLGDVARDDAALTEQLAGLRRRANWAFLRRPDEAGIDSFHTALRGYLHRAEPGSLVALMEDAAVDAAAAPTHQLAHYLFAFDAAGIATFRALALLAAHPAVARRIDEARATGEAGDRTLLRATVLEALRLWPTTPAILRQSTAVTRFGNAELPAGSGILIYTPFFHRDPRLPFANAFEPDIWLDGRAGDATLALVPFSAGPGRCPGRHLVELTASAWLGAMLGASRVTLSPPAAIRPDAPMPGLLDPFRLRVSIEPR